MKNKDSVTALELTKETLDKFTKCLERCNSRRLFAYTTFIFNVNDICRIGAIINLLEVNFVKIEKIK